MDRLIRCITSNGAIMASAVDSTVLVATAQQVHNTSPVATAALGRLLTGASIMGAMLKKEDVSDVSSSELSLYNLKYLSE